VQERLLLNIEPLALVVFGRNVIVAFPDFPSILFSLDEAYVHLFQVLSIRFQNMLNALDMEFEGHPHSGLDDAKNIARVLVKFFQSVLLHAIT